MHEFSSTFRESSTRKKAAEEMGNESSAMLIDRVRESLEEGFYDEADREESERMLRTAKLLSHDPETRKEIDELLADIKRIYDEQ